MANRLWSIGIPEQDELNPKSVEPVARTINVEHVNRLYVDHDTKADTYTVRLQMTDRSKVEFIYQTVDEAKDAFELWRKRIEYAGPSNR